MRNFLGSTQLVTNCIAIFLVLSLVGLVVYTLISNQGVLAAIIGFSSGTIGTITGYYFNKEQLNAAQRDEQAQSGRASGYFARLETLQAAYDQLLDEQELLLNDYEEYLNQTDQDPNGEQ